MKAETAEHPPRLRADAGWADLEKLPKGPNGHALCRWCGTEVTPPKRTFCSPACIEEWKIRTQPEFAARKVFERDRGVCRRCRTQCRTHQRVPGGKIQSRDWEMDHIVPVVEGGGSCGLENLRTLCVPCHRAVTAELKKRLAERRAAERGPAKGAR